MRLGEGRLTRLSPCGRRLGSTGYCTECTEVTLLGSGGRPYLPGGRFLCLLLNPAGPSRDGEKDTWQGAR